MPENSETKTPQTADSVKQRLSVAMAQGRIAQTTQRLAPRPDEAPEIAPVILPTALEGSGAGLQPTHPAHTTTSTPVPSGQVTSAPAAPASRGIAPRKRNKVEAKPEAEKGKRQRVRPETRGQMLERLTNPLVTLHEASVLLRVCTATVRRYSNSGQLPHLRTEGGQRRFYLKDVMSLLKEIEGRKK